MLKQLVILLIVATCSTALNAQDLSVPDSILNELHTKMIPSDKSSEDTLMFKVVYPDEYDSTKTYPILLGLSGGSQSEVIVDYCYAAWFKSNYFKNHLTILPVNNHGKNLLNYSQDDIENMLTTIKSNFQATAKNWIIVGTSNGGLSTFNFLSNEPALFQGGIVIPGIIRDSVEINRSWEHLKIILAYGENDEDDWIKGTEKTKNILEKYVKNVQTIVLTGQGHILPIDFDLDFVYKAYFEDN